MRRGTVIAVVLTAFCLLSYILPAPGYSKGVTRNGLSDYLQSFQLPGEVIIESETYHGTDECRIYQWIQLRCLDSNFLERSLAVGQAAGEICDQVQAGTIGLGRSPDWFSSEGSGCSFRYDVDADLTIGGLVRGSTLGAGVVEAQPTIGSRVQLTANSNG